MATTEIKGKELKGYSFADGIYWHWGDTEVAVIDQATSEIEWCVRKYTLPQEVIEAVRGKKLEAAGKWLIEAKRISYSATQGSIQIWINGQQLIAFNDDKVISDGKWISKIPDEDLGKLVCSAFWHPLDNVYHYSDKAKELFCPDMEKTPY